MFSKMEIRSIRFRCCMLFSTVVLLTSPKNIDAATYIVNPEGNNAFTLTEAMEKAMPGDTVELQDGVYHEYLRTVNGGLDGSPITIIGGWGAIINADDPDYHHRAVEIAHSHVHLVGFSVNGLHGPDDFKDSFIDKCVWIDGGLGNEVTPIEGFIMKNMFVHDCGSECVRLKNHVNGAIIYNNTIEGCGIWDYRFDDGGKNGEGVYIGAPTDQWDHGEDECNDNYVSGNTIETNGNECVGIKEGSSGNVIEFNDCSNQLDANSGCFDSRGDANTIRFNVASDCKGAGVRVGGHVVGNRAYGQHNNVYENNIIHAEFSAIKIETENQRMICGNTCRDGECDVTGEDLDIHRVTALEECTSGDITNELESVPPLSIAPTPSSVVDLSTDVTASRYSDASSNDADDNGGSGDDEEYGYDDDDSDDVDNDDDNDDDDEDDDEDDDDNDDNDDDDDDGNDDDDEDDDEGDDEDNDDNDDYDDDDGNDDNDDGDGNDDNDDDDGNDDDGDDDKDDDEDDDDNDDDDDDEDDDDDDDDDGDHDGDNYKYRRYLRRGRAQNGKAVKGLLTLLRQMQRPPEARSFVACLILETLTISRGIPEMKGSLTTDCSW